MRGFGLGLIAIGVVYLLIAFNMDVSVATSATYIPGYGSVGGGDVANLDLMARRQNHLIVAALITLIGVMLAIFGGRTASGEAAGPMSATNRDPVFSGERDLASDPYRLWLAKSYAVSRNDVFDRFVMGDATFSTLDEALANAHAQEQQKIEAAEAAAELNRIAQEERREAVRIETERADAEFARLWPKLIVGTVLAVVAIILIILMTRETPEERTARLAKEETNRVELLASVEERFAVALPPDAKNLILNDKVSDQGYLCSDAKDGTLITFSTDLTKEDLKDHLTKSLGRGSSEYESLLPDNFDWKWDRERKHYELSMFSEGLPTEAKLCVTAIQ
ncbi:MAG: hypothetical protein ACREBO_02885 [Novosphingobium sp.]